jgi:hypothetical protein
VVVAVLALTLFGPAAASAALTDDVAALVPDAGSVAGAPTEALPDPPVPDVPKVPTPVPLPSASKPPLPSAPTSPAPATDTVEAAVHDPGGEAKGRALGTPSETEGPGVSPGPGASSEPGGRAAARRIVGRSIGPAETAPLRRWRAYVWPAIALRIGDALTPLLARLERFAAVQVPDVFGLSSPSAVPGSTWNDLPSKRSGLLGQDLRSPPVAALAKEGMSLLAALLIGLLMALGLVALARLVVGEELFEVRYWRGHRS